MLGPKQYRFLGCSFNLNALRLNPGIVLQSIVNNTAIECAQRFKFDDITPAANFLSGFLRFFDQGVTGLSPIAANIEYHFRRTLILLEEQPVGDVLQIRKRLALAPDQPTGIFCFYVQKNPIFEHLLLNRGVKAEQF